MVVAADSLAKAASAGRTGVRGVVTSRSANVAVALANEVIETARSRPMPTSGTTPTRTRGEVSQLPDAEHAMRSSEGSGSAL